MLLAALLVSLNGGCSPTPQPHVTPTKLHVAALSQPAGWLAARVGGDAVTVEVLTPIGADPPAFRPSVERVSRLADAELIVAVGMGYEAWTTTATLPSGRLFELAAGVEPVQLAGVTHTHGGSTHTHAGADPHLWTDPTLLRTAATSLRDRLISLRPADAEGLRARAATLDAELAEIDTQLALATAPWKGRAIVSNHPSFHYFARRYGLDITTLDLPADAAPSPASRDALVAWAAAHPHGTLWWEAEPAADARAAVPTSLTQLVLDPLEQPGSSGTYDWLTQMRSNLAALGPVTTR